MKAQKQQRGGNGPRPMYATYTLTGQELYVVGQDQPLNITLPSATGELVVVSPIIEVWMVAGGGGAGGGVAHYRGVDGGGRGGGRSSWIRSFHIRRIR